MKDEKQVPNQSEEFSFSARDPFPEPNTYPRGWLMDTILNPAPNKKHESEPLPKWDEKFNEPSACSPDRNPS